MIHILTGLPHNKNNDKNVCINFSKSVGHKIILGSSTMKMYCRELNIKAKIEILKTDNLPTPKYLIDGIDIASENLAASNSRIEDADMAEELVKFSKNQILSEAATSMIAQANAQSRNVLALLR